MDDTDNVLLQSSENGLIRLVLNRPDKLNALSEELLEALQTSLDAIAADTSARCVIISGAGKAFCAGHDLAQMRKYADKAYHQELFARCGKVMQSIVNLPVPVIAKVHGIATAAGCQLVASCDLAIASDAARFAVSGINFGLFCSTPAVALTRSVLPKNAFDMLVTGDFISAQTAVQYGLINQAVANDALDAAVNAKATSILSKDPKAIRYGKAMVAKQRRLALSDAYAYAGEVMACNMMEPETQERIVAFVEKRHPRFSTNS